MQSPREMMAFGFLIFVFGVRWSTAAQAEWRYCYAADRSSNTFYVSRPFPATQSIAEIEAAFRAMLDQRRIAYQGVACPRADDEEEILAAIQDAVAFNRRSGNTSRQLDWVAQPAP